MIGLLKGILDYNKRELTRLARKVEEINALEAAVKDLSDEEIAGRTAEFRQRLATGESLDDLLPEAFAVVREAAVRDLGQRHFDVQLMGGIVLHEGKIAEMKTGEGKTLVATLPTYLNALAGKGVHIVTVNDYLAKRDANWMGGIYRRLGLSVGVILHDLDYAARKAAYACDVTYGTNNEFGFDYLRDNMVLSEDQMVQRELNYAIVDEVDSILIDEARTPLIISGQAEKSTDLYYRFARLVPRLREDEDYTVDEKANAVSPTEAGIAKVEKALGVANLYENSNVDLTHYLNQALRAHALMKRDRDYIVKDGKVIIVDEFTGRLMFGRRYSQGLHQSIEAKESVKIERESQTLATITFQNYFRMYSKLAGMTGTAATEEEEFRKIYGLNVVVIPTNEPMIRDDHADAVYKTARAKTNAVVEEIVERHSKGQPVLVGTVSIEKNEALSDMLRRRGIPHEVLNAKHHEKEAEIIAKAGQMGAVTIATNMAGRGTDIVLGPGVKDLGGLHVIGTERHEARRIDNQLRGRSGRQGDPGSSRFYVALDDDLMRLFGGDFIASIMERLGWEEDQPIEHPRISKSIETAQKKVESRNFDLRRHVLEYDDVMNVQREVIYRQRHLVLKGENMRPAVMDMIAKVVAGVVDRYASDKVHRDEWDLEAMAEDVSRILVLPEDFSTERLAGLKREEITRQLVALVVSAYEARERQVGEPVMRALERHVMLRLIDTHWMSHLEAMDDLREGVGLRAYGQRDPLLEYKIEAYEMFQNMISLLQEDIVRWMFRVRLAEEERETERARRRVRYAASSAGQGEGDAAGKVEPRRVGKKVGRNDPCPCGSGKKYKKCCGRVA